MKYTKVYIDSIGYELAPVVVTSSDPATIQPDLDVKKNGIPASVIPVKSRQNKTPAHKALLVRQKKLEVQGNEPPRGEPRGIVQLILSISPQQAAGN